ncbi:dehydrogenase [Streptomyces sp. WAC 06738]|uniref:zinc-dependent alcohol dehydrogenase n=1 Tax=Streptomyces sp. WAC 06738 TaxID=2203210 RepID=UPI000F6C82CE|nr:alcohol dehydrogenase catalytic domain-containing protein [Streptomyces sp. WAC 06738]AZM45847.1 dehydrogenase [Streptomyces sp. WAC 06738]
MTESHRAVVLREPGRARVASVASPPPGPGEVRVRVYAAGVCGSDREVYDGTRPAGYVTYPLTPGHEWSGTVAEVGPGADAALAGRRVVAEGFRCCQVCARCRAGETNLCAGPYDETGFTRAGAFAETVTVPARLLHVLDDDADLRAAALLEPAAVAAAAVLRGAPLPGERVAVVGGGTLGLLAVQLLAGYAPAELLVVEPRAERAEAARGFGARAVAPGAAGDLAGAYDMVVETAGAERSAAAAVELVRRGGRVVVAGIPPGGAAGVDPVALAMRQIAVYGVFGASSAAWSYAVRAFSAGRMDPAALITHELPLDAYEKAVGLVGGGDPAVGKVLLRP